MGDILLPPAAKVCKTAAGSYITRRSVACLHPDPAELFRLWRTQTVLGLRYANWHSRTR